MNSDMDELKPSADPHPSDLTDRTDEPSEVEISRRSRRAFLWMIGAVAAVFGGWKWLVGQKMVDGVQSPLRSALEFNEGLWRKLSSPSRRSPEFPKSAARTPRENGRNGLKSEAPGSDFAVRIEWPSGSTSASLAQIQRMAAVDVVTELRCIEGWSEIVHWTGAPLSEFLKQMADPEGASFEYLYAETPDGEYYVALEREAVEHPQTLVCWAMNGEPLTAGHGAPLRLVVPTKYGIKSLKRLGLIRLTHDRPKDYWAERGYDWYAGF